MGHELALPQLLPLRYKAAAEELQLLQLVLVTAQLRQGYVQETHWLSPVEELVPATVPEGQELPE